MQGTDQELRLFATACYRQTSLQLPSEIQARIAHSIDSAIETRIIPTTSAIENKVEAISAGQQLSSNLIKGKTRDLLLEIEKHSQKITLDLESKFNTLCLSDRAFGESMIRNESQSQKLLEVTQKHALESRITSKAVQEMITDLSSQQTQSTDIALRKFQETGKETERLIQGNSLVLREQASSLHQKLDRMNSLILTVKAQQSAERNISNSEVPNPVDNLQRSVWLLVSALQVLIRELM